MILTCRGMNGIETGKAIRSVDTDVKIVYLTAYRDYVAGAFEFMHFSIFLKPVNRQEIINVLEEIFRYMEASDKKRSSLIFAQWMELSAFL